MEELQYDAMTLVYANGEVADLIGHDGAHIKL